MRSRSTRGPRTRSPAPRARSRSHPVIPRGRIQGRAHQPPPRVPSPGSGERGNERGRAGGHESGAARELISPSLSTPHFTRETPAFPALSAGSAHPHFDRLIPARTTGCNLPLTPLPGSHRDEVEGERRREPAHGGRAGCRGAILPPGPRRPEDLMARGEGALRGRSMASVRGRA